MVGYIVIVRKHSFGFSCALMDQPYPRKTKVLFLDVSKFFIHFEYIRNGTIFRCHPNYQSNGDGTIG